MIGLIALLVFAMQGRRLSFSVLVAPAVMLAVAAGAVGGVAPVAAGARVSSGFSPTGDPGNELRSQSFNKGIQVYGDATLAQKAIGRGIASTGNAQQLVDDSAPRVIVESYYLKLLVETECDRTDSHRRVFDLGGGRLCPGGLEAPRSLVCQRGRRRPRPLPLQRHISSVGDTDPCPVLVVAAVDISTRPFWAV